MNKNRRKELKELISEIEDSLTELEEFLEKIEEHSAEAESISSDEQEAFDNMSDSLQEGVRGQAMEAVIGELDSVKLDIDDAMDFIGSAMVKIVIAKGRLESAMK